MIRVAITGGGTGGHLYPALAVAEALKADPDVADILYIGNTGKKEAELVPAQGIHFIGITFSGMPRRLNPALLGWGFSFIGAFFASRNHLKTFRPDVAFGTGGYVTAPVLFAALSLGIPYVVHEPDAYPGLVNRLMGRWATQMSCAFAGAEKRLKTRHLRVLGNPLRGQIGQVSREAALKNLGLPFTLDKPILLVTGGSQGARKINTGVLEALPELIDELGFQVLHQTGENLYAEVREACPPQYQEHPAYVMAPFLIDMASTLALADIAICRSGSMSLSEMYRGGIPTILVPYPYAAADHQRLNALASQTAGASAMIPDDQFTGETLVSTLRSLQSDPEKLTAMKRAAETLAHPHATADVVRMVKAVAHHDVS
jgi:UDP-N-acetylglucosamine--N-acetylmuramyl-(pentapeptide) pyrophosphoryl-undecaprenol N-acetylglucosamine transferase